MNKKTNEQTILDIGFDPPLAYLTESSGDALSSFVLGRLNESENLQKQIRGLQAKLLVVESEAVFARWLIYHRSEMIGFFRSEGEKRFRSGKIDPAIFARWLLENRADLVEFLQAKTTRKLQAVEGVKVKST